MKLVLGDDDLVRPHFCWENLTLAARTTVLALPQGSLIKYEAKFRPVISLDTSELRPEPVEGEERPSMYFVVAFCFPDWAQRELEGRRSLDETPTVDDVRNEAVWAVENLFGGVLELK